MTPSTSRRTSGLVSLSCSIQERRSGVPVFLAVSVDLPAFVEGEGVEQFGADPDETVADDLGVHTEFAGDLSRSKEHVRNNFPISDPWDFGNPRDLTRVNLK